MRRDWQAIPVLILFLIHHIPLWMSLLWWEACRCGYRVQYVQGKRTPRFSTASKSHFSKGEGQNQLPFSWLILFVGSFLWRKLDIWCRDSTSNSCKCAISEENVDGEVLGISQEASQWPCKRSPEPFYTSATLHLVPAALDLLQLMTKSCGRKKRE